MRIISTGVLLLALTCQFIRAEDKISTPDFSAYPQTDAFRSFINSQTNVDWNLVKRSNILAIVSFHRDDRIGLIYTVNERGQEFDVREVYDWATQASHHKELNKGQLEDLRLAIKRLPDQNIFPPIGQLVVVSFKQNDGWITHSYDRTNLPPAMRTIYDIISERFETKDNIK